MHANIIYYQSIQTFSTLFTCVHDVEPILPKKQKATLVSWIKYKYVNSLSSLVERTEAKSVVW